MNSLIDELRNEAAHRKRLPMERVWRAFHRANPVAAASVDQRQRLRSALDNLADAGLARTPQSRKLWDYSATPALPAWVELTPVPAAPMCAAAEATVAWAPELAFAADVRAPVHRDDLLRVQRFLATGGRERPVVPSRERSLELFGDEKRLDALSRTGLFGPDRLSWALLRCEPFSPPMVWSELPSAPPHAIIVENHHTWHTFRRWNQEEAVWRIVAYGAGKAVWSSVGSMTAAVDVPGVMQIEYFGDIDRTGIRIATRLAALAPELALPPVRPAVRWYTLLLDRAASIPPVADDTSTAMPDLSWFPSPLRDRVATILDAGHRLPQELVGWEVLRGQVR